MALPLVFQLDTRRPLDITGAVLQLVFDPIAGSPPANVRYTGTGSFAVTNGPLGLATYTLATADTATPGYWLVYAVATGPAGRRTSSPIELQIVPAP